VSACDPSVLGSNVRLIGVLHPGGATGGALAEIIADFRRAIRQIEEWTDEDPNWLPVDTGGTRSPADDYEYRSAPIPFRDFPFGVSWRLGRGATSSNRSNDQRSIQLFGAGGSYDGGDDVLTYASDADGTSEGYADEDGDLPYEPPRASWRDFDKGPTTEFARLLQGGDSGTEWPDFASLGAPGDGSLGLAGTYRGRFQNVKMLVWADQQSRDDIFCCRALCGDAGQHFQGVLEAMGVARDYLIIRVLPVDTLGLPWTTDRRLIDHPQTQALHSKLLARVRMRNPGLSVALAMGPQARRLVGHLSTDPLTVVELKAWSESGARADWQGALNRLSDLEYDTDTDPTYEWDGERRQIPRIDLPYGSVRWRGTSGDRGLGALQDGDPTPHYVKLVMPEWAYRLEPAPLSSSERAALDDID
jgi:hypothetical protein